MYGFVYSMVSLSLNSKFRSVAFTRPSSLFQKSNMSKSSSAEVNISPRLFSSFELFWIWIWIWSYENPCLATIGKQLKIHFVIRKIFERFTSEDYNTFFQIIKTSKVEQIISLYGDMDFPKSLFVKLLKNSMVFKFLVRFVRKNPGLIVQLLKIISKRVN